jgi:hypothetical protein
MRPHVPVGVDGPDLVQLGDQRIAQLLGAPLLNHQGTEAARLGRDLGMPFLQRAEPGRLRHVEEPHDQHAHRPRPHHAEQERILDLRDRPLEGVEREPAAAAAPLFGSREEIDAYHMVRLAS